MDELSRIWFQTMCRQRLRDAQGTDFFTGSGGLDTDSRNQAASWPMLRQGGVLMYSDMVWYTDHPSEEVRQFRASEYSAMTTVARRLEQATRARYRVLPHFDMGQSALETSCRPLEARVRELEGRMEGTRVLADLRREPRAFHEGT